ncbi:cytochrome P450 family protein [Kutzneria sp. CA-103260]|uniref:cytochrome P450 family protein n=1 Tax=Kutzneria sp. CA-103260 TaxID=2802641 RepID=UPI001BACA139|nr:cytochrome P450 [Kutzneria sp. CA-103260]QUQ63701.1 cytochrome P450 [Kutzneria sp. CA-103260]
MEQPVVLDVEGRDVHGEGARLRARPATRILLPDGIPAWGVTDFATTRRLLTDPRVSRNANRHWPAWQRGEIPANWPLRVWVEVEHMGTAYGAEHRRLRNLTSGAFTASRTAGLRPQIEQVTAELLDAVANRDGVVDLRREFAMPLPAEVICRLFGVPADVRPDMLRYLAVAFDTAASPEDIGAGIGAVFGLLHELIMAKREAPGDDLTSAMIAAQADGDAFTHKEILDTLALMVAAGYETTANLLDHAITALLSHPEQLALVQNGERDWSDVVEETLRWQGPVGYLSLRYAVEDIDLGGLVIPQGDVIIIGFAGTGRDEQRFGATAGDFDLTRPDKQHLSFGHGVHHCLGAALARLEAQVALPAVFERFPGLALAVDPGELRPNRSMLSNGHVELPVTLG